MRLPSRMSVPVVLLAAALAGPAVGVRAQRARTPPRTRLRDLDDNPAAPNTIAGFVRNEDGSLTALPGSPFAAGGVGLGTSLGSQGAIQVADDGRYVLAVDAGSNQISVLRIGDDGSLTPVPGSPFASGGVEPNSIAVSGDLVYVENTGGTAPNYTGFWLGRDGQLTPIPNSTVAVAAGASAGTRRRAVQQRRHEARRRGGRPGDRPVADRQLPGQLERHVDRGAGIAVPGPGPRAVRQPVQPDQSEPAVRLQRAQRRRARHRVGVQRLLERDAVIDRRLAVRR